jgi:hypothetical protein
MRNVKRFVPLVLLLATVIAVLLLPASAAGASPAEATMRASAYSPDTVFSVALGTVGTRDPMWAWDWELYRSTSFYFQQATEGTTMVLRPGMSAPPVSAVTAAYPDGNSWDVSWADVTDADGLVFTTPGAVALTIGEVVVLNDNDEYCKLRLLRQNADESWTFEWEWITPPDTTRLPYNTYFDLDTGAVVVDSAAGTWDIWYVNRELVFPQGTEVAMWYLDENDLDYGSLTAADIPNLDFWSPEGWSFPTGSVVVVHTATDRYFKLISDGTTSLRCFLRWEELAGNAAPSVGAISGLPVGPVVGATTVSLTAQFTDADTTDTHTATWNWGDGGTAEPGTMTENGGAGTVAGTHTYTAPGSYTVTVTVTDPAGASDAASAIITVLSPQAATEQIGAFIAAAPAGAIDPAIAGALTAKVDAAEAALAKGGKNANKTAANNLNALINQTKAQKGKKISAEEAAAIIARAQAIIAALN